LKQNKGSLYALNSPLRQAQLELAGLEDLIGKNKNKPVRKKTQYSHPYYWGPFIMMGNWR
jgi:CHAT domain-containing protein